MNRKTGTGISGLDHIRQSIGDILATPIGTRIARRDYGSLLPELIDQPLTPANILRLYAATALAISRHENRIRLHRITLEAGDRPGAASLTLDATRIDIAPANARTRLTLPLTL